LSADTGLGWRIARIREVIDETHRARSIVLDVPGWAGHRAGQHLDVRLTAEDGYQAQRSFSIASAPEAPGVELTVERIDEGEVSPYLVEGASIGAELEVRGPIGGPFTWSVEDGGPLLLLAGGSGLVPLMAMLRHRSARASTIDARVLISSRVPSDALYRSELERLTPHEGLDVRWTWTRTAAGDDVPGYRGRIDAGMLEDLGPAPSERPLVFICGPTGFVERAADLLVDAGHEPERIRTERFGPG
jgi:ferredoxin-NADP reductase